MRTVEFLQPDVVGDRSLDHVANGLARLRGNVPAQSLRTIECRMAVFKPLEIVLETLEALEGPRFSILIKPLLHGLSNVVRPMAAAQLGLDSSKGTTATLRENHIDAWKSDYCHCEQKSLHAFCAQFLNLDKKRASVINYGSASSDYCRTR